MLQIQDIRKQYITGDLVQTALDGVSLNLRDNEFVAILGPSGSGKTTLLNVIGGLDRYDSGDLVINGISTKKYSDRDWDSYRNHTIGFVFQSYNLIPHQSVLANVELALTISGISRAERRKRAKEALDAVGLGNQLHKRPNQMSGGQMQRVAIARALVNDPDILLADEPTGALDSETSVQVMDLLQEVSKDRLVVMVTHNPELAEEYANRIVRVKDGRIISDTNPYEVEESLGQPQHKNMGKSSMSFTTALSLSFNNLRTKLARTLLTAFAGSIGIIGIALILAVSQGTTAYIDAVQESTLSNYPLTIQADTADMGAALAAFGSSMMEAHELPDGEVGEQKMISSMFSQVGKNDLKSFKAYLEENYDSVSHAINAVQYSYGIRPRIYASDPETVFQVNPSTLFGSVTGNSYMSAYMDSNVFYELIDNVELLESQYEVIRGRWPEAKDELVFVLTDKSSISDYLAYAIGLKPADELKTMMEQVMQGKEATDTGTSMTWTYDDLMNLSFRMVNPSDLYRHNPTYQVWEDMSGDTAYMKKRIEDGMTLSVVGIVCLREGASSTTLTPGIAYTSELTRYVVEQASTSKIVQAQLADENRNVFSGQEFGQEESGSMWKMEDMVTIDEEMLSSAFGMNVNMDGIMALLQTYMSSISGSLTLDTAPAQQAFLTVFSDLSREMLHSFVAENQDSGGSAKLYLADSEKLVNAYLSGTSATGKIQALASQYGMTDDEIRQVCKPLMIGLVTGYVTSELSGQGVDVIAQPTGGTSSSGILENLPEFTLPDFLIPGGEETQTEETVPVTGETSGTEETEPATESTLPSIDLDQIEGLYAFIREENVDPAVDAYLSNPVVKGASGVIAASMMKEEIKNNITAQLSGFGNVLMNYMGNAFSIDAEKIQAAFQFNMNETELQRLMETMTGQSRTASAAENLRSLGYADLANPTGISIYMVDFAAKEEFLAFLDGYNADLEEAGREDSVVRYTDITGIMMSSVRTIIDSVSYALIAFVAVSLVVSSIMIGIITYISVMERTKEIGVLRAIGASKRNISQVFNAETFIIGLCSGLIGIGITLLILIPGNQIIYHLTNNPDIVAQLPVKNALALIGLSMILTLLGGFIPARQAAKKDPVIALRSE